MKAWQGWPLDKESRAAARSGKPQGGFRVACGCLPVGYQMAQGGVSEYCKIFFWVLFSDKKSVSPCGTRFFDFEMGGGCG